MTLFVVPLGVACQPVLRNPISTKHTTYTTTATKVSELNQPGQPGARLQIKRSDKMWQRAAAYSSYTRVHNYPNTAECNQIQDRSRDKAAFKQASSLLHAEESILMSRRPTVMTGTASAQDEGRDQIIKILNASLQTRYRNRVAENIPDNSAYMSSMGEIDEASDMLQDTFYPSCIRPCPAMHSQPMSRDNAGFSDFVLSKYPNQSGQVAVFEFKPFWGYSSSALLDHYFGNNIDMILRQGTDDFLWDGVNSASRELVKQIYGEHVFMGADVAFFTNCDICFISVRVKGVDAQGEKDILVISSPKRWTDPSLHAALTGMSFMAVDMADWNPVKTMADLLCPARECVGLHTPLTQETKDIMNDYCGV
ncbi:hypothetical protein BDP27DRAFT_1363737 [Rhodocollybia butyracea]|uniref:Uncharacterized protein n=1 Tax=Rhodocollybia butyracea TaxID=206335 RepID=A0A9P5U7P9_9AGAR|nr:hypothetical protein BDP27DRAFT_1363737 [Rhodocollybia butyracea]